MHDKQLNHKHRGIGELCSMQGFDTETSEVVSATTMHSATSATMIAPLNRSTMRSRRSGSVVDFDCVAQIGSLWGKTGRG